jgi:hypothetical protein
VWQALLSRTMAEARAAELAGRISARAVQAASSSAAQRSAAQRARPLACDHTRSRVGAEQALSARLSGGCSADGLRALLAMARARLPSEMLRDGDGDGGGGGGGVRVLPAVSPPQFLAEHVLTSRPLVLRGLARGGMGPPLSRLADCAHLRRRCGGRRVGVKSLALDDAEGRPVFVRA